MNPHVETLTKPWRALSPSVRHGILAMLLGALVQALLGGFYRDLHESRVTVLVAQKDLPAQSTLQADAFEAREVPRAYAPHSSLTPEDQSMVVRRTLRAALHTGDILRWADLKSEQDLEPLSARIPDGYRAYRLALSETAGLSDHLRPGDVVDILGSFRSTSTHRQVTRTLFQNVTILSTKPEILIVLSPEQVELLTYARQEGSITLSLRNTADHKDPPPLPDIAFERFLNGSPEVRAVAPRPKGPQVLAVAPKRGQR